MRSGGEGEVRVKYRNIGKGGCEMVSSVQGNRFLDFKKKTAECTLVCQITQDWKHL